MAQRSAALAQYGGTDSAPGLVKLKLQADALVSATVTEKPAKQHRFPSDRRDRRDHRRSRGLSGFGQ